MHGIMSPQGEWLENLTDTSSDWNHQWRSKGSQPGWSPYRTSQFLITQSSDDGKTWSEPRNLTKMVKDSAWWLWAPAPGNGITMEDGTLVFPTQGRDENGTPFSNITYSKDGGQTWQASPPAASNTTESTVVQLDDGQLMVNLRDNRNRHNKGSNNGRAIYTTNNMGKTWKKHPTSNKALKEPVCMGSLIHANLVISGQEQSVLLFSNPNSTDGRHDLTIKMSFDNGKTWPREHWILLDEGSSRGYSSLTVLDKNTIGILYESSRADLVFQRLPVE